MREGRKKESLFQKMNPRNLQKQIDGYGYSFSMGRYALYLSAAASGVFLSGLVFSLRWYFCGAVILVCLVLLPGMILDGYRNMYEHKRFLELNDYMEQMLYSFKQEQKILSALKDTGTLFLEGRMKETLEEAVSYIEEGKEQEDLYGEALGRIEERYRDKRLLTMHRFFCLVEKNGGSCEASIQLLLEDKAVWAENILLLQEDKRAARTRVTAALVITMLLAVIFHGVYYSMPEEYAILDSLVTQGATTLYLILNIFIFRKGNRELAGSWIGRENRKEERKIMGYYEQVMNYDRKREGRKSLLWAAPFFALTLVLAAKGIVYGAVGTAVLGVLMLGQHKAGYRVSYERVVKEINLEFPQWLMELALLLQGNNVQVAIEKTLLQAPAVLQPELSKLVERLREEPQAAEPYMEFMEQFQLSFIQSAMKMLYSISESGNGDIQKQIQELVRRNIKLLDKSEKLLNEKNLAGISLVSYFPQITVSFQMMVNMVVFMMVFLTRLGQA